MAKFITNPGGVVHPVNPEEVPALLARVDSSVPSKGTYHMSTEAEIAAWYDAQGLTRDGKNKAEIAKAASEAAALAAMGVAAVAAAKTNA